MGSWTFEFDYLLSRDPLFDYVLSPNPKQSEIFRYCRKRKWFKGSKLFKKQLLFSWVFRDYIREIDRIAKRGQPLQLLVVDDQALLAALAGYKSFLPEKSELIYYHHGHAIVLPPEVMFNTDKVFFLTKAGYRESVDSNPQFTPEVEVIGNGVSSDIFYPLTQSQKTAKRIQLGFESHEVLITWMANSRPVKGIHLFGKMIPQLLQLDPRIKIVIIGNSQTLPFSPERVIQKGRLNPTEVAEILQISDFYFFTSLWKEGFGLSLVEAIKCGNYILSSKNGGIEDVVGEYSRVTLIDMPNVISSWTTAFEKILSEGIWKNLDTHQFESLKGYFSLQAWEGRIRKALQ